MVLNQYENKGEMLLLNGEDLLPVRFRWFRSSNCFARSTNKGLFIWARLTGLARFPRSRLTPISFVKIAMCSYEKAGQPGYRDLGFYNRDLGNRDENFPIWTLQPGYRDENVFDKLASLSKLGGQNSIILPCVHFHFKSIRISFISKVTRVGKAMIVANNTC